LNDANNVHYIPPPSGPGLKIPILFGLVIALVAANVYMFLQIDQVRNEMATLQESLLDEISSLRETSSVSNETQQRRLETMRQELEAARRQAAMAAGRAKEEAMKRAEELARQLAEEQQRVREQQQRVAKDLSKVAQAAQTNVTRIGEVKTSVEQTRSELEKTIAALKQVTGDLGVQSGLIATNSKELAALKALGQRNYYEFDIRKSKRPVRVGDIALRLRDTSPKRNRFTLDIIADDKRITKRKRFVNEPLQFYVAAARQPYEVVVNRVEKDRIVGYLSTPKVKVPRGQSKETARNTSSQD